MAGPCRLIESSAYLLMRCQVLLFDLPDEEGDSSPMSVLQELFGDQLGEYFGAAVLAEDVTGDGLADLLVGAPLHSTQQQGDAGRVYVYVNLGEVSAGPQGGISVLERLTGERLG